MVIFIYYNACLSLPKFTYICLIPECTYLCYCLPVSTTAAVIGFNGTAYQVSEADGFVEFVFGVLEGELAEGITVEVGFMTVAGTAQGA